MTKTDKEIELAHRSFVAAWEKVIEAIDDGKARIASLHLEVIGGDDIDIGGITLENLKTLAEGEIKWRLGKLSTSTRV